MTPLRVGPLVRATSSTRTVIWAEFFQPGEVILSATPFEATENSTISVNAHTVTVGGRHYAAPQLTGLQPATWYNYRVGTIADKKAADAGQLAGIEHPQVVLPYQCFRTLDSEGTGERTHAKSLLLAYGSCRKSTQPRHDALSAFGSWLTRHFPEREATWPRLLLLIGDQIYADEPSESLLQLHPYLQGGARTFSDFASMLVCLLEGCASLLSTCIPRQFNIALTLYHTPCTLTLDIHGTLPVAITRRLVRNKLLVFQFRRESQ